MSEVFGGAVMGKIGGYSRRLMGLTYAILCEMEIAYVKKDDALVKDLAKKWKGLKKEGHKKYTDD